MTPTRIFITYLAAGVAVGLTAYTTGESVAPGVAEDVHKGFRDRVLRLYRFARGDEGSR